MNSGHPPYFANAQVMALDPATVEIPARIGFLHQDKAAALGRLMAVDGQRDPIKVVAQPKKAQPWRLVTGMHRLTGAALEQIDVYAIEVLGKPEDLADLEASENLHRRPLGPIERAKFTAALVQAAQDRIAREHGNLKQQALAQKARWDRVRAGMDRAEDALTAEVGDTCDKMSRVYGWAESTADALGFDKRTIQRDLTLFRLVIEPFPDLAEALSLHPVVGENASQLRAIAQVKDEGARRTVIEALLADPEIGADDARILAGVDRPAGPAPAPYQKHLNAIEGGLSRLGRSERHRFVRDRLVELLSKAEKRDLRDRLNEELGA